MTPDITIKEYYLKFIRDASKDIIEYNTQLNTIAEMKEQVYNYIIDNADFYSDNYNINLKNYECEIINKCYNPSSTLYNKVIKLSNIEENNNNRIKLLQIVKYCNIIRRIYEYDRLIILADKRKNMPFKEYRRIVINYYNKVHRCVLSGMGYKFNYGIGVFCINRWTMDADRMARKKKLDFAATSARKKELLAQGIKIYNDCEAAWYKARGLPYNGVDYRVYKTETYFYEIGFINSTILSRGATEFKHTEYISSKYRGLSYSDMANHCKDLEDISNFQVDIRYKLNMFLHKYPTKYLTFIRNADQNKYKYRTYSSQD